MQSQELSAPGFQIRHARPSDVDQLVVIEKAAWEAACDPDDMFTAEQFARQIEYVGGFIFVAEEEGTGRLLGYVSALRLDIPLDAVVQHATTWYELTGDGWYTTHQPNGLAQFGGSIGVPPEDGGEGVGQSLIERELVEMVREGMEYTFLGGRLPGMRDYLATHPGTTPEAYFKLTRDDGLPYDEQLRYYVELFEPIKLMPGYFRDQESCDYGVLLLWRNPYYGQGSPEAAAEEFQAELDSLNAEV